MPLPAILAAGAAASSIIGDLFAASEAEKAKERAIAAYKKLLLPSSEIDRRADDVGDTIYTQAMGELNKGAFAYRGALNPETLRTIAYGRMAGLRAEQELESKRADESYNRQIQGQIAGIEAQPVPGINWGEAISGGVEGYLAGTQIEMGQELLDRQKQFYDVLEYDIKRGSELDVTDIYMGYNKKRGRFGAPLPQ